MTRPETITVAELSALVAERGGPHAAYHPDDEVVGLDPIREARNAERLAKGGYKVGQPRTKSRHARAHLLS